jgi:hypothetical protein
MTSQIGFLKALLLGRYKVDLAVLQDASKHARRLWGLARGSYDEIEGPSSFTWIRRKKPD